LRSSLATKDVATPSAARGEPASFLTVFNLPTRWPIGLLLLALLLSIGSVFGLARLHPDARADLLVDPGSGVYKDQSLFADTFGADPVVIMAQPAPGASLITPDHFVGFSHLDVVHNAAHDYRHSMAFPCH